MWQKGIEMTEQDIEIEELEDDENAVYRLTPSYILYDLLSEDAGFDVGGWKPFIWESIYNEFMNRLERAGYISKADEK